MVRVSHPQNGSKEVVTEWFRQSRCFLHTCRPCYLTLLVVILAPGATVEKSWQSRVGKAVISPLVAATIIVIAFVTGIKLPVQVIISWKIHNKRIQ